MSGDSARSIAAAEAWFLEHGLPYFVESERRIAQRGLRRGALGSVLAVAVLAGVGCGALVGWLLGDISNGMGAGLAAAGLVLAFYAATTLRLKTIAWWAVVRTFRSLGLLFPLVTRALPLLLLFITFLFINAEVWQVAASLDGGVLWLTVMLFTTIAVGFLLVRLPEELDAVNQEMRGSRLMESLRGTPLESAAAALAGDDGSLPQVEEEEEQVAGFQRANLILVLLVSQIVQVFLLALAVLLFFLVFGVVAMSPQVVESWIGEAPHALPLWPTLSLELIQVSVFLAAFSGLYFTVYAVTDETYREQFFTAVIDEIESAVGVRAVYRAMRRDESA